MYAYIKNGGLILTSDSLFDKQIEEVAEMQLVTDTLTRTVIDPETGKEITEEYQGQEYMDRVIVQPFVPGLIYDEVIEYTEEGRVTYENGKLIPYEESEEKAAEDKKAEEEAAAEAKKRKETRPQVIIEELGKLKTENDGLALVGGDTTEVEARITALKEEYAEITA